MTSDVGHGTTRWQVDRWDADQTTYLRRTSGLLAPTGADFTAAGIRPYLTTTVEGNLITNAGWTRMMTLLTGGAGQTLTQISARIGVGNATTPAEAYADTDLAASAGAANRWFQPLSGAPALGTRTTTLAATFGTGDGNFAWNEFGIDVATPTVTASAVVGALLLNHKVGIAQGTKVAGQTWTATATLTFT